MSTINIYTKPTIFQTQKEMFKHGDENKHSFFFACDKGDVINKGKKEYGSSPNLDDFLAYHETVAVSDRNFYEILRTDVPRCEYYDIDLYAHKNLLDKSAEQIFLNFKGIHSDFVSTKYGYENRCDWLVTDSSRKGEKISIHLINRNRVWKTSQQTKQWYEEFIDYIKTHSPENAEIFDTAVSSSNRLMRILGSSKFGEYRPLEVASWHTNSKNRLQPEFFIQNVNYESFVKTMSEVETYTKRQSTMDIKYRSDEKQRVKDEENLIIYDLQDMTDDPVENLITLITSIVDLGTSTLCSSDASNKFMSYQNFRNLTFAYVHATSTSGRTEESLYNFWITDIYPYYESAQKHASQVKGMWSTMYPSKANGYTIASLHYWARENPNYKALFKKPVTSNIGVFNTKDKSYYWGDFKGEMTSTIFESMADAGQFFIENFNRVCVPIKSGNELFYLKTSLENSFERSSISFNVKYETKSKTNKTKVSSIPFNLLYDECLSSITRYNELVFEPYDILTASYNHPKNFNSYIGMRAQFVENVCMAEIQPIIDHIKLVLCDDKDDRFQYVMSWLQHIVKFPNRKTKKMLCFYSDAEQIGKGIIFEWLINWVFGTRISGKTSSIDTVIGKFNAFRENKLFICLDESVSQNHHTQDSDHERLKSIITDPNQTIERKGFDPRQVADYSNFVRLTNNILRVDSRDARSVVFKCNESKQGDMKYFSDLATRIENQDVSDQFYTYLYNYKDTVSLHKIFYTEERTEMIYASSEQPIKFFSDIKASDYDAGLTNISTLEELYDAFLNWSSKCGHKQGIYDINKFKVFVKRELGILSKVKRVGTKISRAFDSEKLIYKPLVLVDVGNVI